MCRKGENIRKRKDGRWEARYIKYRDPEEKSTSSPMAKHMPESKRTNETKKIAEVPGYGHLVNYI